jgi:DnaJ homolog subfamily C member 1
MDFSRWILLVATGACLLACVRAWGSDEMELFDLVEEVNQNFYEVLGIKQVC